MARKSSAFRREAKVAAYELELENGKVVTFKNPSRLATSDAFALAEETDVRKVIQILLGDDYDEFWAEFSERPVDETNEVVSDVMEYYGADPNSRKS